jgi:integral membrane sensor domain MASE1
VPFTQGARRRSTPLWAKALLLAVAYLACAEIGDLLSIQSAFPTFWPAAGLFFAVLLIADRKDWPALVAAVVVANVASDLMLGRDLLMALGFSAANTLEIIVGATLVGKLIGDRPKLDSLRQVVIFALVGAIGAPVIGATVGTAIVVLEYSNADWWTTWLLWWEASQTGGLVDQDADSFFSEVTTTPLRRESACR